MRAQKPSDRVPVQRPSEPLPAQKSGPVRAVDTPQLGDRLAAQRARDSAPPENITARGGAELDALRTNPLATPLPDDEPPMGPDARLSEEELFGQDAMDALAHVSDSIDASARFDDDAETITSGASLRAHAASSPPLQHQTPPASALPPVPVVRFSKSMSIPPPVNEKTASAPDPNRPPPSTKPGIAPVNAALAPSTKPGIAPVNAALAPHRVEPRRSSPPSNISVGTSIAERAVRPRRTWLLVVGGLVLAGITATAVVVMMADRPAEKVVKPDEPRAMNEQAVGTVRFVLEPADAEIKIAGKRVHTGSPFSSSLAAGIHQIEIHREGYRSWLRSVELSASETQTLHIVLEPLTASADASLMISTTPSGLDVVIDGKLFDQRTPIKTTLKVGPHTIAVRQNGVEVWTQKLDAEAASDYEFNPSFTAAKQRERAERAMPAPSPRKTPPPAPAPEGAPPPAPAKDSKPQPENAPAKDSKPQPENAPAKDSKPQPEKPAPARTGSGTPTNAPPAASPPPAPAPAASPSAPASAPTTAPAPPPPAVPTSAAPPATPSAAAPTTAKPAPVPPKP
jgi:hypothetical protein